MAEQKNIMSYETVALDDEQSALVILDQTKLPYEVEVLHLTEQKDIWDAIYPVSYTHLTLPTILLV